MTTRPSSQQLEGSSSSRTFLARAWIGVALTPVFFFVGFAVGEVLYSALGYKPENDDAPLGVDLIASLSTLAVALVPCLGAVSFGRRAYKAGNRGASFPTAIGALLAVALMVLTALNTS